jgi:hypothetical protein
VSLLNALLWEPTPEVLYRNVAGAKQLCSEFRFQLDRKPGYKGERGFIKFDSAGRVTVSPGYTWDGASGPTIDMSDSVCAALGHDVQYELMAAGILPVFVYKDVADLWFYNRLRHDGMESFRAWAWYKAVKTFGVPGMGDDDIIHRAPVPFPAGQSRVFTPIPGYTAILSNA